MSKLYLAYGSNLNLRQMAHRCPTAKLVGTSTLEGYELLFRGRFGGAVATIEPKDGSSVSVGLFEITPADEKALDVYEGFPRLYRKEIVKVKLNNKTRNAMVYIMNDGYPINIPSKYYYDTILEGYCDCDLDTDLLEDTLEQTIKRVNG